MSIISRFSSWLAGAAFKAAVKANKLTFLPAWIKTTWMEISWRSLVRNGYKASSAVFGCVRALAHSFPEPPLVVWKKTSIGDQPENDHPLRKLIERPNPDMGEAEFMQYAVVYASVGGNCYIWKQRSSTGRVVALWPMHDGQVTPVPGQTSAEGLVKEYLYDPGDGRKIVLEKEDVIHWKWMPDPEQPWRGMGAIEAAARDVSSDVESTRYVYALLKNDAIPRVVVTLVEGDELTEEKAERLSAAWQSKYGGDNRGAPAFLEAGMTVQRLGMNMMELSMEALKEVPESRICAAFGVPPVIASLLVGLKRSDYGDGQARKAFTETTLTALWRAFASELQAGLVDDFGGGVYLRYDMNQVTALRENVGELWSRIDRAIAGGYITRAEARRALGFDAGPEDDVYRESLAMLWVRPGQGQELPEPSSEGIKALPAPKTKSLAVYGRSLQRIRLSTAVRMEREIDDYFSRLADRVVSRAEKALKELETKDLPAVGDLLTPGDERDLLNLVKRWYIAIAEASWETINLSLGVTAAFDLTDPAITEMLKGAGRQVREITETTRQALVEALQYGNEQGWSIAQLVRGDENQPGIRQIVEETYRNRAKTIARTELGNSQNAVAANRYEAAGLELVEILDNGDTDDDEECQVANGQIWTVKYFREHPLEHPNCSRAPAPYFGDRKPDRS